MGTAEERHYTPQQVAEMWGLSDETVRKMFAEESGVLKVSASRLLRNTKRRISLRIPASVLQRVHEQRSSGGRPEVQLRRRGI
jgi:hypothetical protein